MVVMAVGIGYGMSGALTVPTRIMLPCLILFAILGAYGLRNSSFDLYLMFGCGAFGYLLKVQGYSPAAIVMGVILAPIADNELIRMFQLYGADWYLSFFQRPLAAGILALLVAALAHTFWRRSRATGRAAPRLLED
jgi:putative tricarboxylic transport membrane protein